MNLQEIEFRILEQAVVLRFIMLSSGGLKTIISAAVFVKMDFGGGVTGAPFLRTWRYQGGAGSGTSFAEVRHACLCIPLTK